MSRISRVSSTRPIPEPDEWSSLIAFTVIAMVKVEYDKTVTGAELRHCNTVEDLFNLVAAK